MADFHHVLKFVPLPARIWSVLLDVERWPEWTPTVTRVNRLESAPSPLAAAPASWQPKLSPAVWCVTSLDERRRVSSPGLPAASASRSSPATRSNPAAWAAASRSHSAIRASSAPSWPAMLQRASTGTTSAKKPTASASAASPPPSGPPPPTNPPFTDLWGRVFDFY